MRKLLMALMTVAALSIGIVWAETAGKTDKAGMDCSSAVLQRQVLREVALRARAWMRAGATRCSTT